MSVRSRDEDDRRDRDYDRGSDRDRDRYRDRRDEDYDRGRDRDRDRDHRGGYRHREDDRYDRDRSRGGRDERDHRRGYEDDRRDRRDDRRGERDEGQQSDKYKFMNPERARMLQRMEGRGGADEGPQERGRDGGEGGPRRGRGEDEPPPELYSIHRGKVASLKEYGVFVELEGRRRHGLVHISQVSGTRIEPEDLPTIVEVGETVWVKVVSLADNKVSLSMKYVSQTNGEDLDANNVDLEQNAQRRKPRPNEPKRIELGAILPTTCTKCGAGGHLASECYSTGGQKYDLIPEPEGGDEPTQAQPEAVGDITNLKQALKILARASKEEKRKKRKHKKDKKDKKEKKSKKDKKDKKERHRKRSRRSSGSDSD